MPSLDKRSLAANQVNGQDFSCMVEIAPERS